MSDLAPTLLPPNATPLERVFEQLMAARLAAIETSYRAYWSADDCPIDQLPWLAWALSIDEWDPVWAEEVRRAQVARAIDVQRKKGTVAAVESIIAGFGGTASLREWWQLSPPGPVHTFDVIVAIAGSAPSLAYVDAIIRSISAAKPLRSHFTFTLAQNLAGAIGLRGTMRPAVFARTALVQSGA